MIFWIAVIVTIIAGLLAFVASHYDWFEVYAGSIITFAGGLIATIIMLVAIIVAHVGTDGYIAKSYERYDSLTYQYENNVYDNENDLGKRELLVDIQKWNEDLANNRENQDDFWVGIFTANIYDQFAFIEWEEE